MSSINNLDNNNDDDFERFSMHDDSSEPLYTCRLPAWGGGDSSDRLAERVSANNQQQDFDYHAEKMRQRSLVPLLPELSNPSSAPEQTLLGSIKFYITDYFGEISHNQGIPAPVLRLSQALETVSSLDEKDNTRKLDPIKFTVKAIELFGKMSQTKMGKVGLGAMFILAPPLSHILLLIGFAYLVLKTSIDKKILAALVVAWLFSPLTVVAGLSYFAYQTYINPPPLLHQDGKIFMD